MNGFGNAPDPMAQMYQDFITAPDEESRFPFLGDGMHDVALASFVTYNSTNNGFTIKAEVMVLQSSNPAHPAGSFACKMWTPHKQVKNFPTFGKREVARTRKFVGKLMHGQALNGAVVDEANPELVAQVVWYLMQNQDAQPARGIAIRCHGSSTAPKQGDLNKSGEQKKAFTDHTWETLPGQTPQSISQYRQAIERVLGAAAAAQQQAQAPAQPTPPAAQGFAPPGFAPQAQPQGYPPGVPGFAPAPAQPAPAPAGGIAGFMAGQPFPGKTPF